MHKEKTNMAQVVSASLVVFILLGLLLVMTYRSSNRHDEVTAESDEAQITESLPSVKRPATQSKPKLSLDHQVSTGRATEEQTFKIMDGLEMSQAIRVIIGLDGNRSDAHMRMNAQKALTRNLSEDDVQALLLFLDFKSNQNRELSPIVFNSLKNVVVEVFLQQDDIPEGLGSELVRMYSNLEHDEIWRDYCIQFFAAYYEAVSKSKEPEDMWVQEERVMIQNAYWDAVEKKDKTFAGTALIGLEGLSRRHNEFDRDKIQAAAKRVAADEMASEANRITAMRLSGLMKNPAILPTARFVAQTGESALLRMAAIATLGDVGKSEDEELLASLVSSSEKRIATVASVSLQRLKVNLDME